MNKSVLVEVAAKEAGITKAAADKALSAIIGAVVATVAKGESVTLVGFGKGNNPVMSLFSRIYAPALSFSLRARGVVIGGALVLLAVSGLVFSRLGSEFVPQLDEGSIVIQPVRVRTVDAEQTVKLVTAFERKVLEVPEVLTVFSRSGTPEVATDPMPLSLTDSFIMLKPRDQWRKGLTKEGLVEELEAKVAEVPGQGYNFSQSIVMRFSELVSGVKADVGIKVFGEDLEVLRLKAEEIKSVIAGIPGAADVEVEHPGVQQPRHAGTGGAAVVEWSLPCDGDQRGRRLQSLEGSGRHPLARRRHLRSLGQLLLPPRGDWRHQW